MTDETSQPTNPNPVQLQPGNTQLQNQPVTLHNTLGLIFMSILAFILLVALLRHQSRSLDLIAKMTRYQS
jgi:hypothetical protein